MEQEIAVGKQVQVINQDLDGWDFIEGIAVVKGVDYRDASGRVYCSVLFEGDEYPVYRWIRKEVVE